MEPVVISQQTVSRWEGYVRHDFLVDGREALVVEPHEALPGKPWVWRTEFFGAFDQADRAMLKRGWHLAHYKLSDMYGCPAAVERMRVFHNAVVPAFGLYDRTVPIGLSRGGLYAFQYAATHPERVMALYLDAPVLDIRSWPYGHTSGGRWSKEWQECLQWYGLTEESAAHFRGNPLDRVEAVTAAGIPIILVAGDADDIVPYEENGAILVQRVRQLGGVIEEIVKPGCGHHPHSLEDPTPIADFLSAVWERERQGRI